MPRPVLHALLLIAVGAVLGVFANAIRPDGIPWVYKQGQESTQVGPVDLAAAKRFFDEGKALFVDARPAAEFAQGHVKGAVSLPEEEMDAKVPAFAKTVPLDRPLIVYCSGEECNASVMVGEKLADAGYLQVHVFFGGWPEWQKAGYPTGGRWD